MKHYGRTTVGRQIQLKHARIHRNEEINPIAGIIFTPKKRVNLYCSDFNSFHSYFNFDVEHETQQKMEKRFSRGTPSQLHMSLGFVDDDNPFALSLRPFPSGLHWLNATSESAAPLCVSLNDLLKSIQVRGDANHLDNFHHLKQLLNSFQR